MLHITSSSEFWARTKVAIGYDEAAVKSARRPSKFNECNRLQTSIEEEHRTLEEDIR